MSTPITYEAFLAQVEKPFLREQLAAHHGNVLKLAKSLELNRATVRKKLAKYQLHAAEFKQAIA
jgi:DNA-binding protein Fis